MGIVRDVLRHLRDRIVPDPCFAEGTAFVDDCVADVMTNTPITVRKESLAADAFKILKSRRIDELPVVDARGRLLGIVDVQDLLDTVMV